MIFTLFPHILSSVSSILPDNVIFIYLGDKVCSSYYNYELFRKVEFLLTQIILLAYLGVRFHFMVYIRNLKTAMMQ